MNTKWTKRNTLRNTPYRKKMSSNLNKQNLRDITDVWNKMLLGWFPNHIPTVGSGAVGAGQGVGKSQLWAPMWDDLFLEEARREEDQRFIDELMALTEKRNKQHIEEKTYVKVSFEDIKKYGWGWERFMVEKIEEIKEYYDICMKRETNEYTYIAGGFLSRMAQSYFEGQEWNPYNQKGFDMDIFFCCKNTSRNIITPYKILTEQCFFDIKSVKKEQKMKKSNTELEFFVEYNSDQYEDITSIHDFLTFRQAKKNHLKTINKAEEEYKKALYKFHPAHYWSWDKDKHDDAKNSRIAECRSKFDKTSFLFVKEQNYNAISAHLYCFDRYRHRHIPVQFVGRKHSCVENLMDNFDLSIARIATDGQNLIYQDSFPYDIQSEYLTIDGPIVNKGLLIKRINKYMDRGYKIKSQQDIKAANHKNREIIQAPTEEQLAQIFWPWFINFRKEEFYEDLEYCY